MITPEDKLLIELGVFAMQFDASTTERRLVKRAHDMIEAQAKKLDEARAEVECPICLEQFRLAEIYCHKCKEG